MILGTTHRTKNLKLYCHFYLDGCKLNCVTDTKFLGIIIDENLNLKSQINNICKWCSKNVGVLNKVKHFLPKQSLYQLYCTSILPHLMYGILLWGTANKEYLTKIFKIQKRSLRILRIISNSSYLCHTNLCLKSIIR